MAGDGSGAAAPESIVARLRPHARAMFWPSVALVIDAGATAFFAGSLRPDWLNFLLLGVSALIAVLVFFGPLLSWLNRSYTITTRRIVLRQGVLVRTRQELLHSRGYDVTVRKAGLQLLFGSGDVIINTGLENPVVLRDIPSADLVQSALHDLMEKSLNPIAARRQQERSRRPEWEDSDLDESGEWDSWEQDR